MKLEIKVTKEILRKSMMCGTQGNEDSVVENCALALAVRDIFPEACVEGYRAKYKISPFGTSFCNSKPYILLPADACSFIDCFDDLRHFPKNRLSLPELTFTVDVPDAVIEKINIDQLRPMLENHPTLKLIES